MEIKLTDKENWQYPDSSGEYTWSYGTTTGSAKNAGYTLDNTFVYQDPDTKRWYPVGKANEVKVTYSKETKMARGLFVVYVVNVEEGELVYTSMPLVADNEELAKLTAARELPKNLVLADYDFVVLRLGNVREKSKGSK